MFCHSKAERKKWEKRKKKKKKGVERGWETCYVEIAVISDVCENINKWNCIVIFQKEQKTLNVMHYQYLVKHCNRCPKKNNGSKLC